MVVVGLDRDRALAELERLAPPVDAPSLARARASGLELASAGAADRIADVLEADP
jgi:hypothetical protein